MHGCTYTFLCGIGPWMQSHLPVFWGLIIGTIVIVFAESIYVARCLRENWQQAKENQIMRQEQDNEWKTFQHRMRSLIWQGEEWEVDVRELKATTTRLTLLRKAAKAADNEQALCTLPLLPLIVVIVIGGWFPTLGMLMTLGIVFLASVGWWVYHGLKWQRYRQAFHILNRSETDDERELSQ